MPAELAALRHPDPLVPPFRRPQHARLLRTQSGDPRTGRQHQRRARPGTHGAGGSLPLQPLLVPLHGKRKRLVTVTVKLLVAQNLRNVPVKYDCCVSERKSIKGLDCLHDYVHVFSCGA